MRKKYTSKTYMRGVTDRDLLIIKILILAMAMVQKTIFRIIMIYI